MIGKSGELGVIGRIFDLRGRRNEEREMGFRFLRLRRSRDAHGLDADVLRSGEALTRDAGTKIFFEPTSIRHWSGFSTGDEGVVDQTRSLDFF